MGWIDEAMKKSKREQGESSDSISIEQFQKEELLNVKAGLEGSAVTVEPEEPDIEEFTRVGQAEDIFEAETLKMPAAACDITETDLEQYDDRLVMVSDSGSVMSEEYRAIRTRILARFDQQRHLIHTITSATPREGKTISSMNLALAFSELSDRRTLVLEGDLRMPTFGKLFPTKEQPGLIQLLRGEALLDDVIQQTAVGNLDLIHAGGAVGDEAIRLISGGRLGHTLELLRSRYDHVIIDTPPVLELADAGILAKAADELMMVVRCNRTPRHLVNQAVRILQSYNTEVGGMILTNIPSESPAYHSRYGYRYRYRRRAYGHGRKTSPGYRQCA